ncbi:ABC transporter ATP-binding protein [Corynebacterium felinum]|uniref:ABC-2 type transport system ATP-binding protein n=1 Tax=Corynebacterium felinum TaxID=131318 RepID=A0ABU2B888_9CORY|nr:ABC transporter ATP-binding protein [Corynebacterium felinum]MDF5820882.1 ABC transporter ATP-binding protein [Corynebacterium felinum]MDR7354606.1 ABC-2 type transport system ATP-binding protein [Corynebacterium felinum]WJY93971.1 putative ABC transporter ATP-binding protein YxlF [Corynebacterium felinum]
MITVRNLSKTYRSKKAVTDLSFTVPDGYVTGFLGPNGSGKSTTMRCMLGLDTPTTGTVTFSGDGYDAEFASLNNKHTVAGAVLDAALYTPARSGRNHLRSIAAGAGIPASRVDECLDMVGLTSAADAKVGGYSLGMRQRLGVAAALLGDPQHLILDEPVNGLDPEGVTWMRTMIRDYAARGRAVLVSSHLLSEMEMTADRLVVIGKGQLIGEYSLEEFLADGTRVVAESPDVEALVIALRSFGMDATLIDEEHVHVPVGHQGEKDLRTQIAHIAHNENVLITALHTRSDNLEQRFLAATASAQEYRTH